MRSNWRSVGGLAIEKVRESGQKSPGLYSSSARQEARRGRIRLQENAVNTLTVVQDLHHLTAQFLGHQFALSPFMNREKTEFMYSSWLSPMPG